MEFCYGKQLRYAEIIVRLGKNEQILCLHSGGRGKPDFHFGLPSSLDLDHWELRCLHFTLFNRVEGNMLSVELLMITEAVIASLKPGARKTSSSPFISKQYRRFSPVSNEVLQQLRTLFPDTLILAALDLVDRDSGGLISCWTSSHSQSRIPITTTMIAVTVAYECL
jgi:hypothetical protein